MNNETKYAWKSTIQWNRTFCTFYTPDRQTLRHHCCYCCYKAQTQCVQLNGYYEDDDDADDTHAPSDALTSNTCPSEEFLIRRIYRIDESNFECGCLHTFRNSLSHALSFPLRNPIHFNSRNHEWMWKTQWKKLSADTKLDASRTILYR